ncbi:MAG: type 4a pilus biogenesis protein PilO [Armatimonadetes bacterium]|nr:type 4a pilus biogenesis protein PilO [Armatimonadota bacterium]
MNIKRVNTKLYVAMSALTFVLASGASYLQFGTMNDQVAKIKELKAQVDRQDDLRTELDQITLKVSESREKLDHLEQGVPPRAYMPTLMTELETLGKQNGIVVTGVRPLPNKFPTPPPKTDEEGGKSAPVAKTYEEQYVEVKGTGYYLRVLAFLTELEKFPKIVAVTSVTLKPIKDGSQTGAAVDSSLEITIEIKAFLFPETQQGSSKPVTFGGNQHEGV